MQITMSQKTNKCNSEMIGIIHSFQLYYCNSLDFVFK